MISPTNFHHNLITAEKFCIRCESKPGLYTDCPPLLKKQLLSELECLSTLLKQPSAREQRIKIYASNNE